MIYDVQIGAWIYFKYPNSPQKEAKKHYWMKRGYFPYNFNFVKGLREECGQCSYCGIFIPMKNMTRDHSYPKSLGGAITTTSCYTCNTRKRDLKPIEFAIYWSTVGNAFNTYY